MSAQHVKRGVPIQLAPNIPKPSSVPGMGLREHHRMSLPVSPLSEKAVWMITGTPRCLYDFHRPLNRISFLRTDTHPACLTWLNEEINGYKNSEEYTKLCRTNAIYDYDQHWDPFVPRYYKLKIINHQTQGLAEP